MVTSSACRLQDTTPDELLSAVMTAVMADVGLSADRLGDVCVGETALLFAFCQVDFLFPEVGVVLCR